jgi:hypothetical protein
MIPNFLNPNPPVRIVAQDYNLIADVNTIILPSSVTGEFIHQIFEMDGTSLIPQPNIQMYYNGTDWLIDLTDANPMTVKIKFLKA